MNDFTKDELNKLLCILDEYYAFEKNKKNELYKKINSLIDSHCNHIFSEKKEVDYILICPDCKAFKGWVGNE